MREFIIYRYKEVEWVYTLIEIVNGNKICVYDLRPFNEISNYIQDMIDADIYFTITRA